MFEVHDTPKHRKGTLLVTLFFVFFVIFFLYLIQPNSDSQYMMEESMDAIPATENIISESNRVTPAPPSENPPDEIIEEFQEMEEAPVIAPPPPVPSPSSPPVSKYNDIYEQQYNAEKKEIQQKIDSGQSVKDLPIQEQQILKLDSISTKLKKYKSKRR